MLPGVQVQDVPQVEEGHSASKDQSPGDCCSQTEYLYVMWLAVQYRQRGGEVESSPVVWDKVNLHRDRIDIRRRTRQPT